MHLPVPLSSMHLPNRIVLIYVYVSDGYKWGYTSPLMLGAYQVPAWRDDKLISHFGTDIEGTSVRIKKRSQ